MMRSIRSRILGALLILLTVALSVMSWRSYADARIEIEEVFDAQLTQSARMLAVLAHPAMTPQEGAAVQQALRQAATLSEQSPAFRHYVHEYESKLAFVVFRAGGSLILASPSAPVQQLDSLRQLRESGALHASRRLRPGPRRVKIRAHHYAIPPATRSFARFSARRRSPLRRRAPCATAPLFAAASNSSRPWGTRSKSISMP